MEQLVATPILMARFTTSRFNTGKVPGIPRQIGQVFWFGFEPNKTLQEQKILDLVLS
jgi:hypothetical protein